MSLLQNHPLDELADTYSLQSLGLKRPFLGSESSLFDQSVIDLSDSPKQ